MFHLLLVFKKVESLRREFRKCDRACNGLITLKDLKLALAQQGLLRKGHNNVGLRKMLDDVEEGPDGPGVIRCVESRFTWLFNTVNI